MSLLRRLLQHQVLVASKCNSFVKLYRLKFQMYWHQWTLLALFTLLPFSSASYRDEYDWNWKHPPYYKTTTSTRKHSSSTKYTPTTTFSSTPVSSTANPTESSTSSRKSRSKSKYTKTSSTPTADESSTVEPTQPSSSDMRLTTTTCLTSALTVTSLVTLSSGVPQNQENTIPSTVDNLNDCSRPIVLDALARSRCGVQAFDCFCTYLTINNIAELIREKCTAEDMGQFENDFLGNLYSVGRRSQTSVHSIGSITGLPLSTTTSPGGPTGNITVVPFNNSTTLPVSFTSEVVTETTGAAGETTLITTETVLPVNPAVSPSGPSSPEFTGAAVAVEAPEFLGGKRVAIMGGVIGFMGLVFAEL
ncbi:hypothetical protein CC78DRAFT_576592 [Lojkania enalia]|uniref:Extracellular membrane protein CFEM domain-containing protein n=1 Tax=Lojkania enalia TaxID=147567 RepID=A0A9P4KFZ9_9PLEO|nr:hypothetical protein CC78DRAFT_576592 [Didymosphaeria enalia]